MFHSHSLKIQVSASWIMAAMLPRRVPWMRWDQKRSRRQAVQAGEIDGNRVARYRELLADVRLAWKNRYQ